MVEQFSAPEKPATPKGPTTGKTSRFSQYETSTTDNDSDFVYYSFDWGDGTMSQWLGPYESGEICTAAHKWEDGGTYQIRVSAMDDKTCVGTWSDPLSVSIPKTRMNYPLFLGNLLKILNYFEENNVLNSLFIPEGKRGMGSEESQRVTMIASPCNC